MARRISPKGKAGRTQADSGSHRPTPQDIVDFLAANPDQSGKREIARAFGLKGVDRVWLKDVLREMADDGLIEKQGKRLIQPGGLPHVVALDIFSRDHDGLLLARPAEWAEDAGAPPLVQVRTRRGKPAPGIGDRVLARVFPVKGGGKGPAYTAQVLKKLDRTRDAVLGVLRKTADGFRIEPVVRGEPEIEIPADALNGAKPDDLVEVEPQSRAGRYGPPRGRVAAVVGSMDSEKAISMIAIHAHGIPNVFPETVIKEAEAARPAKMSGREDWRKLPLLTIDPADAKDHDDAVRAEPDTDEKNPGGFIVDVAIADVAAYVTSGSAMDREALKRGNSVYFPDRVVPMLPERISNDLCSLREKEDRPALAVRMIFDAQGRKLRHSFHRIMMRSAARLAYPQAQAAIDGSPDDKTGPLLDPVLKPLWDAYKVLKKGRDKRQPLELDLPERKILLKEDGTVDRVVIPERLDAHKLIEEFMIQANVAAAETLEAKRRAFVYRAHDAPSLAKQEALREFLQTVNISLARGAQMKPAMFNKILDQAEGTEHAELINEVVLRSQSQAVYTPENLGHFGLNLRRYAHFTSPIRRYADLIVHRALIGALGLGPEGLKKEEEDRLEETAALISASERRAMAAERETVDRLVARHLADRIGSDFAARISGVTKSGLFVQLPLFGADGFIPVSTLGDEYYFYDESAHALVGERTGKGFRLADRVDVRLVEVAPLAGAMRFEMLSEPGPLPAGKRSFHKSMRRGGGRTGRAKSTGRSRRR
ncbi:MAG: ribonuclease R [Rhizobiaceae bacterium]|nr:ribonuclease R [Rhizobiaceae bacterium]